MLGVCNSRVALMILQALFSEDSAGEGPLMATVFFIPYCVYIMLLMYWGQARMHRGSPAR